MRGDTSPADGDKLGREAPLPRQLQQVQDDDLDADLVKRLEDDDDDDDDDDEGRDEEVAGLVPRLSDEEERSARRARNEGGAKLGRATTTYREGDDDYDDEDHLNHVEDGAGSRSPFVDRREQRARRRKPAGVLATIWAIAREALPTLAISVLSLVFSGELLIHLARWPVFVKVDKLFILVPILLNLKGNLEGNLSLRMSTSANIGELDIRRTRETLIFGNLALLQVQALIVSLFAGILASVLGVIGGLGGASEGPKTAQRRGFAALLTKRRVIHHHPAPSDPSMRLRNSYFEFVLVIATGMLAASMSSAILGSFMCALVVVTRQLGGNPDNIASPLAGSLGDLLTLTILGLLGSFLVRFEGTILATLILIALAAACACCFFMAYRNAYVRELLSSGWIPLVVAMFISSGAGLVLDAFVQRYEGFALLVPVATGLPGACSAIFVSRISTALHSGKGVSSSLSHSSSSTLMSALRDILKLGPTEGWIVPATLFTIGAGIEVLFLVLVWVTGQMSFGWPFAITFVITSGLIVAASLYISHLITLFLWSRDYDPDIYCLPYVTSLIDVIGQILLVVAFATATVLGDQITAAVNDHQKP